MSSADVAVGPIRRAITVECSVEQAFVTFTDGIGTWWPLDTHSIGAMERGSVPVGVAIEPRVGGVIAEQGADGSSSSWGRVLVWEPPHRLVLEWQPGSKYATEVEVRFTPDGDATRVDLEHRAWEHCGDDAEAARASYEGGWPSVLRLYAEVAGDR